MHVLDNFKDDSDYDSDNYNGMIYNGDAVMIVQ